jgi:hypothetical protein
MPVRTSRAGKWIGIAGALVMVMGPAGVRLYWQGLNSLDILPAETDIPSFGISINGLLCGQETKVPHLMRIVRNSNAHGTATPR